MNTLLLKRSGKRPMYMQIYDFYKVKIEKGMMDYEEKLPSIRELSRDLSVSKITIQMAYDQLLSEGYIENKNRARYTVAQLQEVQMLNTNKSSLSSLPHQNILPTPRPSDKKTPSSPIIYDFSSGEMDPIGFDFALWKRYMSKSFQDSSRLTGYGHLQGEPELRKEISKYISQSRGVNISWDQIIVAPGVQYLLSILCSLLQLKYHSIAFEDPGFQMGQQLFQDRNYEIHNIPMSEDGIQIPSLSSSNTRLVYVSPSHQFPTGLIMPVGQRKRLLHWAEEVDGLIIEDDYDSEFRYYGHPIPALKGLDSMDRVIYLGSFSKIIPPSIRISYMVLPQTLMNEFHEKSHLYKQSTSTIEQLTLASFMHDGHMEKQIRRLRKYYQSKRQAILASLDHHFTTHITIQDTGSGLFTLIDLHTELSSKEIKKKAMQSGCMITLMEDYLTTPGNRPDPDEPQRLLLYFSSIPMNEIDCAVLRLKNAIF